MVYLSLALLLSATSSFATEICLDKNQPITVDVQRAFAEILKPSNKSAVPPGEPDEAFKVRKIFSLALVRGVRLVMVRFSTTAKDPGFVQAFNFWDDKGKMAPVEVPDLGAGDSRFRRARFKVVRTCGRPSLEIVFDGCPSCEAGRDLKGHFDYNALDKKWTYFSDTM